MEAEGMPWADSGQRLAEDRMPATECADVVVLFTGHRIDAAGRDEPRFPAEFEGIASKAVTGLVERELEMGRVTGLAGGANGGDILFLEACRRLGVPFQMLLALPEKQFVASSVASAGADWVVRFEALARAGEVHVMAQEKALPGWLKEKTGYSFWQRNNMWLISSALALDPRRFVLAALWDGQAGDGSGGTQNMVEAARRRGAEFVHLDTRELFVTKRSDRVELGRFAGGPDSEEETDTD
jgi:hypothetical protein